MSVAEILEQLPKFSDEERAKVLAFLQKLQHHDFDADLEAAAVDGRLDRIREEAEGEIARGESEKWP